MQWKAVYLNLYVIVGHCHYMLTGSESSSITLQPGLPSCPNNVAHVTCRFIYITGQLIRHGAAEFQTDTDTDAKITDMQQLLSLLVMFFNLKSGTVMPRWDFRKRC